MLVGTTKGKERKKKHKKIVSYGGKRIIFEYFFNKKRSIEQVVLCHKSLDMPFV